MYIYPLSGVQLACLRRHRQIPIAIVRCSINGSKRWAYDIEGQALWLTGQQGCWAVGLGARLGQQPRHELSSIERAIHVVQSIAISFHYSQITIKSHRPLVEFVPYGLSALPFVAARVAT